VGAGPGRGPERDLWIHPVPWEPGRWHRGGGVHAQLEHLLALQETEQEILRLRKLLASLPREKAEREARFEESRKLWEEKVQAVKDASVEVNRLELELKAKEGEIEKLEVRLNTAKSNAEYTAIQNQIKAYKEQNARIEDRVLELYDQVEEIKKEAARGEDAFKAEEATFREFLKSLSEEEARIKKEMEALRVKAEEIKRETDPDALQEYEALMRYFANHGGVVVSPVVGGVCKACGSRILPNDEVKLLRAEELVHCKACSRILYLPERSRAQG